jgi:hypothetical protein
MDGSLSNAWGEQDQLEAERGDIYEQSPVTVAISDSIRRITR